MTDPDLPGGFPAGTVDDRLAAAQEAFVALDFDGTLAPIVEDPTTAEMIPPAREALAALADRPDVTVAVVSGRALDDLRGRVPVDGLALAGNHGLRIETADRERVHEAAADARDAVAAVRDAVEAAHADDPEVAVEDKDLSLAVHYRGATDPTVGERVRETVAAAVAEHDALEHYGGKAIQEVTPAVDWDKGAAVEWLREELTDGDAHPVYVGDDTTDEDAFRALAGEGTTVHVGEDGAETAAEFTLPDPQAVAAFLDWLARR